MRGFSAKLTLFSLLIMPAIPLSAEKVKSAKSDPDLVKREQMITIARQLGVDCMFCHNLKNLKSDEKKSFKTAKKHGDMVNWLNTNSFSGNIKVDCYICHRGQAKPSFQEPKGF
ncbi:MAG: hypothetical protein SGJ18_09170 [Pseudomonadota bacterium]|nr:hypothetical protein [Pseudomonadota bacterium]